MPYWFAPGSTESSPLLKVYQRKSVPRSQGPQDWSECSVTQNEL